VSASSIAVLIFVGLKMLAADLYPVPIGVSLAIVLLVPSASIAVSWLWPPRHDTEVITQ
jgi:predicted tellurium resistance membrane protein TerC